MNLKEDSGMTKSLLINVAIIPRMKKRSVGFVKLLINRCISI
jgi:hypothetical protein